MKNKKIYYLAFGFFILFVVFYLFLKEKKLDITNFPSSSQNIIAFGDSLVVGLGSKKTDGFIGLMSQRLKKETGYEILNKGISGDTTSTGLKRLQKDVLNLDPKIVLLSLGGNDFLQKKPVEDIEKNLNEIIKQIHQKGAVVIVLGIRGGLFKNQSEKMFERIVEKNKTAYVPDILDGIIFDSSLMSDSIHPNDSGYEKIAKKVYPILKKLVQ